MTQVASEKQNPSLQIGVPLAEFRAAVDTLLALQEQGRYQVFLARENVIRLIGDVDEFRAALGKRLGSDPIDVKKTRSYLEEVQMMLQVIIGTGSSTAASRVLESNVYESKFGAAKGNKEVLEDLRNALNSKVELVSAKLTSDALTERSKRLATVIGPMLEDLDVEVVSKRQSFSEGTQVTTPFLRIKVRYSVGGETRFPFSFPSWLANPFQDSKTFELECDESDVDVLISRLLQAKEILRQAIDAKVKATER